ncbi:hypothetical protein AM493_14920 [Flavobacterium akiainvivens]|uniref:Outer membrane protein beta-barrel domain-containing protein n=1 Tax=Flavobacterium akiainvivens TaxID=1202724 RepID=A0A0M9VJ02_9FLAO|nr:hypothetical protein [Flavobacterium akiainvivens]KOS07189.1 hypothetical protein AM493_14920 [Flavobacterium akiainvivens]SFQ72811.1 hypothetical protein SAMN05444144_11827 [Flavobacterium akiainvivens]
MKKTLLAVALCCLPYLMVAQNKIETSKETLNSSKSDDDDNDSGNEIDEESIEGTLFFAFVDYVLMVGYWGAVGYYDEEPHLSRNVLTHHPYQYTETGNYYRPFEGDSLVKDAFRFDVKNKFLYGYGALYGNHLEAKIRPWRYFYFTTDYYQILEKQIGENTHDNLSVFYFNFAYDRIRLERFNLGWTLGAGFVGSGVNRAGISYGLNAEYFFKKRISLAAGATFSHINKERVHAYEAEIKRHSKNFFLSLGFEHLEIAGPNYNFVSLGAGFYF